MNEYRNFRKFIFPLFFLFITFTSKGINLISVKAITGQGALELKFSSELKQQLKVSDFLVKASGQIFPVIYGYLNPKDNTILILCLKKQMLSWPSWEVATMLTNPTISYIGTTLQSTTGEQLSQFTTTPITYPNIVSDASLFVDPQPYYMGWENEMWWKTIVDNPVISEIHVDNRNPNANDSNPGSVNNPLKTINKAISLSSPGTKIIVHPGTYREQVNLPKSKSGTVNSPLILESLIKDSAIVTGADILTNWSLKNGVYSAPWKRTIPLFSDNATITKILGRHQEMLFVNGVRYDQTLDSLALTAGKFWVKDNNYICVKLPDGIKAEDVKIEATLRNSAIVAGDEWTDSNWPEYFEIKGFSFVNSFYGNIIVGRHTLVQDCSFLSNNQTGLITGGFDFAVRGVTSNFNGGSGIVNPASFQSYFSMNGLVESTEVSYNNWRIGDYGGQLGWFVAGIKVHNLLNSIFRGITAINNHCTQLWMDIRCNNFLAEDCYFTGGTWSGFWTEISYGEVMLRNNMVVREPGGAMTLSSTGYEKIRGNLFYKNNSQIGSWEINQNRDQDHKTIFTDIKHNVIVGSNILNVAQWPTFYSTLKVDSNFYFGSGWNNQSFPSWRKATFMQDAHSYVEDPQFRNGDLNDFFPSPNSNLAYSNDWVFVNMIDTAANKLKMVATQPDVEIRYTTDGTQPIKTSTLYTIPINNPTFGVIKARAYKFNSSGDNIVSSPVALSSNKQASNESFTYSITGQDSLVTYKNVPLPIKLNNIHSNGNGFVQLIPSVNYTIRENLIIPDSGFVGYLRVPLFLKGYLGETSSKPYDLIVKVVDSEKIQFLGQDSLSVLKNTPIIIPASAIHTSNTGSLLLSNGANFSLSGVQVTPAKDFVGQILIPAIVTSSQPGVLQSDVFYIKLSVKATLSAVNNPYFNEFSIYPNPCKNLLKIESNQELANSTIYLYNTFGEQVFSQKIEYLLNSTIDCSKYPSGIYFLKIQNQVRNFTQKIIILP